RSAVYKIPMITNKQLKLAIQDRLMTNKKQYSSKIGLIAIQICKFSVSTLVEWYQNGLNVHIIQQRAISKISNESKVFLLELEDLTQYSELLVASTVLKLCNQYQLDPTKNA
ncbi:25003_t:CDS:2, partial [Gigaspora margarita]